MSYTYRYFPGAPALAAFALMIPLMALPAAAQDAETPACHDAAKSGETTHPGDGAHAGHAAHAGHGGHAGHAMAEGTSMGHDVAAADVEGLNPQGLDVELLDQDGNTVRFYSDLVKDKVVAMNFVFTTCTTVCPPMGASFGRLQKELGETYGRDIHLISVSVDPVTDTPNRLKAWAERFDAGDGWTLVTGPKADVNQVLKALGVFTPDAKDHSPLILLGDDRTGVWQKAHGFTPPAKLAGLLEGYLAERQTDTETDTMLATHSMERTVER